MSNNHYWIIGRSRFSEEFQHYLTSTNSDYNRIRTSNDLPLLIPKIGKKNFVIWAGGTSNSTTKNLDNQILNFQNFISFFKYQKNKFYHIYLSSAGTLYPTSDRPVTEDGKILPNNIYSQNKFSEEQQISSLYEKGDYYYIFRLTNVYASSVKSGNTGLITLIDSSLVGINKSIIYIRPSLTSRRQYGWYPDYVSNIFKILNSVECHNKIINLAPSVSYSIAEIIDTYAKFGFNLIKNKTLEILYVDDSLQDSLYVKSKYTLDMAHLSWNTLENWIKKSIFK
jgi:UDP-glucose 4-epimerase